MYLLYFYNINLGLLRSRLERYFLSISCGARRFSGIMLKTATTQRQKEFHQLEWRLLLTSHWRKLERRNDDLNGLIFKTRYFLKEKEKSHEAHLEE